MQLQHKPEAIPKIAVVVTAYDRREFVLEALESVLNQNIDRNEFEIILVKNFADEGIDSFANSNGVRLVHSDEVELGKMALRGISCSSAEIVSLMDDDDIFHRSKLDIVLEVMSNSAICFLHNEYNQFTDSLPSTDSYSAGTGMQKQLRLDELSILYLLRIIRAGGTSNSSSVTFRREILEGYEWVLEKSEWGPSFTLFSLALVSGGYVCLDDRKLTYVRIHESLSNPTGNSNRRRDIKASNFSKSINTLHALLSICDNKILRSVLKYEESEAILRALLYADGIDNTLIKEKYSSIFNLLSVPIQYRPVFRSALAACSLVWRFLPIGARLRITASGFF